MKKVLAKRQRVGLLQRSKAGSGHWINDSVLTSPFREIHWLDIGSPIPDDGTISEFINSTSSKGIHIESERRYHDKYNSLIRVPFSGLADMSTLSMFLCAAMQVCDEAAGSPYKKTFTSIGLTSVPNFAGNEGYLFDMAIVNPASSDDGILLKRGIISDLKISVNFRAKGQARLFRISGTFVFNQIEYRQTFVVNNWVNQNPVQNFLNNEDVWSMADAYYTNELSIGGVGYSSEYLHDFELNINNNVDGDNFGASGIAGQYIFNNPRYTGTINFWHNEITENLITATRDNDEVVIYLTNDSAVTYQPNKLHILGPNGYATKSILNTESDYLKVQIQFELQQSGTTSPLTIIYSDGIDYGF